MSDKTKEGREMSPRTGRPTTNPKNSERITVRLDNESSLILSKYCEQYNVDKGKAVRIGIKELESKIKK